MAGKSSPPVKTGSPKAPPAAGLFIAGLGAGLACVVVVTAFLVLLNPRQEEKPPPPPIVQGTIDPPPPPVVPPKAEAWWDSVPDSTFAGTVALLAQMMPQDQALFDHLGSKNDTVRRDALQKLIAKLPEIARQPKSKLIVERLLIDWYAWEPAEKNVTPLKEWFVQQVPKENAEYPPDYTGAEVERSFWALHVSMEILTHKATRPERVRELAHELGQALGFAIDPSASRIELTTAGEKLLALRCYRNLLATTAKSAEHGLALRGVLVKNIGAKLSRTSREQIDFQLAAQAFPSAKTCWDAYRSLLQDCLKSHDGGIELGLVAMYGHADAELAAKMEPVLADKWNDVLANPMLKHEAKVRALHTKLGVAAPVDRATQLDKVTRAALAGAKSPAQQATAVLQETARLSHAATLACALLKKEAGQARFDELIAEVPEIEAENPVMPVAQEDNAKKPDGPKLPGAEPMAAKAGAKVINDQLGPGAFSKVHVASFKRGKRYSIHMVSAFDNFLRLQNSRGAQLAQDDDSGGGLNALILFTPPYDDAFKIIATSPTGKLGGAYTLTIEETKVVGGMMAGGIVARPGLVGFGGFAGFEVPFFLPPGPRPFPGKFPPPRMFPGGPPMGMPGGPPPAAKPAQPPDQKPGPQPPAGPPSLVDEADLKNLATNVAKTRIAAFQSIAAKLKGDLAEKDLTNAQAVRIAKFLVSIQDANEVDAVTPGLTLLARSRNLMLALADAVDFSEAKKETSELIVGKLLQQPLQFGKDTWRPACRKLLLLQALDQTGKNHGAAQAADALRELYQEQALLFGMDAKDLAPMTRPAQVMDALIAHVAATLAKQHLTDEQKAILEQTPRQLRAAQFAAQNDLEHTVMLQRIWIKVLAIQLEQHSPKQAQKLRQVQEDLSAADRVSVNVLEQLRDGEEKLVRLWGLALDAK